LEAGAAIIYFFQGRMREADQRWEHAAQRAEQQHLPDSAGVAYGLKAVHDALVSNCSGARDAAHRGLALDRSAGTVPNAALALALCGEPGPAAQEAEAMVKSAPTNTLVNEVYLPEVKAATALLQRRPQQVADLLASAGPYVLVSKAPQFLGRAALEMGQAQQAVAILNRVCAIAPWV
jgi:hypothetical protein